MYLLRPALRRLEVGHHSNRTNVFSRLSKKADYCEQLPSSLYMNDFAFRKRYLLWLEVQLGIHDKAQWYSVNAQQILCKTGSRNFLNHYQGSLPRALMEIFCNEFSWKRWLFTWERVPKYFWTVEAHRREYIEWLSKVLNIEKLDQWYSIKRNDILRNHGKTFLEYYDRSLQNALSELYPEHSWKPWLFSHAKLGFWKEKSNRKSFFDWLFKELNLQRMENWYSVKVRQVIDHGGGGMLVVCYGNSLQRALLDCFPEFQWNWRDFGRIGDCISLFPCLDQYHQKGEHQSLLFRSLSKKTGMNQSSRTTISNCQLYLYTMLYHLFPNQEIICNYRHPQLLFSSSNQRMELDIFFPLDSLAIEYQGENHYRWTTRFGSPTYRKRRDQMKREKCGTLGLTFVEIPYWWNQRLPSLMMHIGKHRPDLADRFAILYGSFPSEPSLSVRKRTTRSKHVSRSGAVISDEYSYAFTRTIHKWADRK